MKKKLIAMVLAAVLLLSFAPAVLALDYDDAGAAQALYELGLFKGTGTKADGTPEFDLGRTPTRHEAVTMLVRLLGKESAALAEDRSTPFTDVAVWAKPYVGYAYANGLTSGTSATAYSGEDAVTASQYLTFVLRAMGYESGEDFQWDKAWELSDAIGMTDGRYGVGTGSITRGDMAWISYRALDIECKTGGTLRSRVLTTVSDTYTLLSINSTPPELGERRLTDAEIAGLKDADLDTLRAKISTFADFTAWLKTREADYYSAVMNAEGQLVFGGKSSYEWGDPVLASNMTTSLAMYMLEDDFPGMGIAITVYTDGSVLAANYFPTDGGYILVTPEHFYDLNNNYNRICGFGPIRINGFNGLISYCTGRDKPRFAERLSQIVLVTSSRDIAFDHDYKNSRLIPQDSDGVVTVYTNDDARYRSGSTDMGIYGFPAGFDTSSSIDRDKAIEIVNGSLENAAEQIKTLPDLINYLYYSGYRFDYSGDRTVYDSGSLFWHFNYGPHKVFELNQGNCGASAGFTAELLKGDYDEVGFVGMTFAKGEGGHIINYVRSGDTYLVFDSSNLATTDFASHGFNLVYADSLDAAVLLWNERSDMPDAKLMYTYTAENGDSPVGWDASTVSYLVSGYAENVHIVKETPAEGYVYQYKTVSSTVLEEIARVKQ